MTRVRFYIGFAEWFGRFCGAVYSGRGSNHPRTDRFQRRRTIQRSTRQMAADVSKNLERAKKFLDKNRFEDAIEAYLAVLQESPQNVEAAQMLGDLYTRLEHPDRAAVYYGHLFELLVDPRDEAKAVAIYNRFLRNSLAPQPPERIARYAFLQQKSNHPDEAIDQYIKAAELFSQANRMEDALF